MCLPHFKNLGSSRQSLLQRELQECQHVRLSRHTSHVTRHTSHATRHMSHVTRHTSHVTRHTSHVTRHTSHVTRHTSHVTRHTSHVTRCTRHTSHVNTRHTSHVTRHQGFSYCRDLLVGKIEDFKAITTNENTKKSLHFAIRKLDKMRSLLSEFLQQQFPRGEVRSLIAPQCDNSFLHHASSRVQVLAIAQHSYPLWREPSPTSFICEVVHPLFLHTLLMLVSIQQQMLF
jgi:hypothetical protein